MWYSSISDESSKGQRVSHSDGLVNYVGSVVERNLDRLTPVFIKVCEIGGTALAVHGIDKIIYASTSEEGGSGLTCLMIGGYAAVCGEVVDLVTWSGKKYGGDSGQTS